MVLDQFFVSMVGTTVGSLAVDSCKIWGLMFLARTNVTLGQVGVRSVRVKIWLI